MLDKLLFGDNQFFGINHMSEEKARAQAMRFQRTDAIMDVLDVAYDAGINTFMCTTHDRIGAIAKRVKSDPARYPGFQFYPCMPYAHKYANAVTEHGMVGALREFMPKEGLLATALTGTKALATKEVDGIEARLRSRFGWGLTVSIEPPDFETRVAILLNKAQERGVQLDESVAFLIAKRMRSNVRDLEGALNTLFANARFSGREITEQFAREVLRDLLTVHDRLITIENIQKTVAEYYKIRVADLLSKSRSRMVTRPRQTAMALAKDLTNHSLPEIGDAFGGRDHTTVLHACKRIKELREADNRIREDFDNLLRILTT